MKFGLSFLLALFSTLTWAQMRVEPSFTGCGTDQLMQANPALQQAQQALDLERYAALTSKSKPAHGTVKTMATIPVVVHIVHNGGTENISDAQVQAAISDFNTHFAQNPNNQIQFCLAQRDPNGNATTGITRNVSALTTETMETNDIALKDINRWAPTCYLNIWVIKEILSISSGPGVVGYAYFPSSHGQPMDGVVIEAGYFGSNFSFDAVGTHEIGHYLGLYHTFEGGCINSNCLLNGDRVCDTPPDQTTFASCNPQTNSCSTDADDPSANNPFTTDVSDLGNDYMDYSDMSCYNLFTDEQHARMYYFLTTARNSLLSCLSCTPPCPMPAVTATITDPPTTMNVLTGATVNFTGTVTNATNYEWYIVPGMVFSNGLTTSYTFPTAGSYWVKFRSVSTNPSFCLDGLDSVLIIVSEPPVIACTGSLLFDATNNISVDLPDTNAYYSGTNGGYTWECWFRLNDPFDGDVRPLISSVDQVTFEDQWLGFGWQGGFFNEPVTRLVFKVDGPNSTVPSAPNCSYAPPGGFAIGTWYHAAGVMNYTTQESKLYVNGQVVDTRPITTPPITRTIPTELSYNWSNDPHSLRGNMDEVRIWNKPRTDSEIATYYNQCVDPTEQNLLVYYHCNQSAGTTVVDATPNHWDGTFSVAQGWSADQPTLIGTACIASCIEICGNGIDDNNDGQIDENCDCQAVSAGADTMICSGHSVQLNATSGYTDYLWSPATGLSDPTIANPIASPSATTTYTLTALALGPELVVNGDFSAGNVGFISNQNYSTIYSPCNYGIGPTFFTYPDPTLTDHTPTSDNMMMAIDGCQSPTIVWEETMLVIDPNTNYTFSFWASRADQVQPTFEIHLIGNVTGDLLVSTTPGIPYAGTWTWDQYGVASWGSGSNTAVIVRVINLQTNSYGNDFAMDDFSFRKICSATDAVQVTINGSANLTLDLGPDIGLCSAGTHTFDAGSGFASYLWNDGTNTQTFTAFGVGTYWVTATDSCGGTQTDTVHITLSPTPTLDLGPDRVICLHTAAQLGFTSASSFTSYQWSPSTNLSCDHCPNPIANPPASTLYHLMASTAQGCIATDSVQVLIEENAPLSISVTVTDATCENGGIVQLGMVVGGNDQVWYNFNHQGFSHNTSYSELLGGVYPLTVQNGAGGCEFDTIIEVKGEDYTVYIPNAFTPNGDTYNTQWYILGNCIAELECRIFNRWGQQIFVFDDIDEGWDGKYEGKPVPDGVYTYAVRLVYANEDVKMLTGFITVLR